MLINVAISGDRNVIKKGAEKILKFKDLPIEIQHMWDVKARVIPVVIWVNGTISKSLRQYLSNIPGSADVKEQNIFHGRNNITCSTNCKYRTAATLYTLET